MISLKQTGIIYVIFTFVIISASCKIADEAPSSPPVWPEQFEQDFEETMKYPIIGQSTTKGKFFYDWINKRYRVDRDNGKWDRYCGSVVKLQNTPCSHIVSEGKRYLWFPKQNYCCYCCDAEHGCGILKPDWLAGATFEQYSDVYGKGVKYEQWNKKGLQNNFAYATTDSRKIIRIDQQPNDIQDFDLNSLNESITDPSVFNLPSQCKPEDTCPWVSVCTPLRK